MYNLVYYYLQIGTFAGIDSHSVLAALFYFNNKL